MLLPTPTAQPALHNGRSTARLIPAPNAGGMAVKAEQVRRRLRSDARLVLGAVLRLLRRGQRAVAASPAAIEDDAARALSRVERRDVQAV